MEKKANPQSETYYDLYEDWDIIEASFLKQYNIRLRQDDDMSYQEFCSLLSGIMPDTPLGQIVSIRAEKDAKVIKNFTKEQKRIRTEWIIRRNRKLKNDPKAYSDYWSKLQREFKAAFS
ncbi:MAG: Gp15 family bacteriophage protein [Eubacteriales bacterium]|nr:Gp15 family bacteriophage protein [Eubacteriales bacterium]